jgi:nucleoside diphosphate kinase
MDQAQCRAELPHVIQRIPHQICALCYRPPLRRRRCKSQCGMQLAELDGFTILEQRSMTLTEQSAREFYKEHTGKPFFDHLVAFMTSGPMCALLLSAPDAVKKWRALMGPTNTQRAQAEAPSSLRAIYGTGAHALASLYGASCAAKVRQPPVQCSAH